MKISKEKIEKQNRYIIPTSPSKRSVLLQSAIYLSDANIVLIVKNKTNNPKDTKRGFLVNIFILSDIDVRKSFNETNPIKNITPIITKIVLIKKILFSGVKIVLSGMSGVIASASKHNFRNLFIVQYYQNRQQKTTHFWVVF